jgi:hypothetical protein
MERRNTVRDSKRSLRGKWEGYAAERGNVK